MLKRNLWKIVLSLALAVWAGSELSPLQDAPHFEQFALQQAIPGEVAFTTEKPDAKGNPVKTTVNLTFADLVKAALQRVKDDPKASPSAFVALTQLGHERKLDLTRFFPDINIESTLKNIDKRNSILLSELLRRSKGRLQLGLDLHGGVAATLEVDAAAAAKIPEAQRQEKLTKAIEIIGARINAFGVAEPLIRAVGTDRIEVQLPGVSTKDDPDIWDKIGRPAQLTFRLVHPDFTPLMSGETPAGYEVLTLDNEDQPDVPPEELYVKRIPAMAGDVIEHAYARPDLYGKPEIDFNFTAAGRQQFADVTREIAAEGQRNGRTGRLAIVLDGKLYSAPTVKQEIDSPSAQITGNFTDREAINLADILNNPLDLPLKPKETYEVGPTLARDAVSSGELAAGIGTLAVALFMITFYTTGGLVAVGTLMVNILIILGVMANLGATMTLPGLAGIVLTIGMAVDANILIFERMREERAVGKSLSTANQSGFGKALMTILDAHCVQLIICAIMIWLGTGPIKGFGVTLAIGVLSTLFTVLITGHLALELLIDSQVIKQLRMPFQLLKNINVDFVKYGKPAFIGSWLLVLLGVCVVFYKGHRIEGIDFAGGDVITLQFKQQVDTGKIREIAAANGIGEINPAYVSAAGGGQETLKIETPEGKSGPLLAALQAAYPAAGLEKVGEDHVGASIGKEILWNAVKAVVLSMLTIFVYIAFRFEWGFGIGAMVSTIHDILMTIGVFVLTGHQFNAPMVAAILCIAGYSINETVVVFDRIREELRLQPTGALRDIVNTAIRKVFSRTIMTASTTFLAALALFIFGGGVLRDISFTFLVGIVTSTFSAIFVAAQVFYWYHKGDRGNVEKHADLAPVYEWTGSSKASE
jgi:SecD/SecF fusion protein